MHSVNLRFKTSFFTKIVAVRTVLTRGIIDKSVVLETFLKILWSCLSKKSQPLTRLDVYLLLK